MTKIQFKRAGIPAGFLSILFSLLTFSSVESVFAQSNAADKEREWIRANHIRTKEQMDYRYVGDKLSRKGFLSSRVTYDSEGRATEIVNYQNNGLISNLSSYSFDPGGNQKEYIKYTGNKDRMLFKQTFNYDEKGNKISETGYNGTEEFRNVFTYNAQNKVVQIQYFLGDKLDETRLFKYSGNEVEVMVNDNQGALKSKILNKLDAKGNITMMIKMDRNGMVTEQTEYTYYAQAMVSTEEKTVKGSLAERTTYKYDPDGNITEKWTEQPGTDKYLRNVYSYKPDGRIAEEKWRSSPTADFSYKKYSYDPKGMLLTVDSYFASYKYRVLNKFNYK